MRNSDTTGHATGFLVVAPNDAPGCASLCAADSVSTALKGNNPVWKICKKSIDADVGNEAMYQVFKSGKSRR
jgi:hypothetical protein